MANKLQVNFFYILLIAVSLLMVAILLPYVLSLFMAVVLAVVFYPVYKRLLKALFGQRTIAALITMGIVCLFILIPLAFILFLLFQEAKELYIYFTEGNGVLAAMDYMGRIQGVLNKVLPDNVVPDPSFVDLQNYASRAYNWLGGHVANLFSNTLVLLGNLFVFILGLFFFLRDGNKFKDTIIKLSPLKNTYDESILHKMELAVSSIIKGSIFIALVQGLLTGVGFAFFGVPSPVLWGSIAVFTALLPSVGTAIVAIPAVLYLAFTGGIWWAIGLLLWSFFVVGSVDNLLRPFVLERGIKIHPFLIFLSVFGGISFFGPLGFIIGPIILSLLFTLVDIHSDMSSAPRE